MYNKKITKKAFDELRKCERKYEFIDELHKYEPNDLKISNQPHDELPELVELSKFKDIKVSDQPHGGSKRGKIKKLGGVVKAIVGTLFIGLGSTAIGTTTYLVKQSQKTNFEKWKDKHIKK